MTEEKKALQVGLVMPIATIDNCTAEHWVEVRQILTDAVQTIPQYNFEAKLVSYADEVGVIQKTIVQNLYKSDIVICDVSCKNPNVMFELGLRLAFDKPTIIVKDDFTNYTFDTGIIEHLDYPRDLRFAKIVEFKAKLAHKVTATYEHSLKNPDHSTFLKNFGEFKVASLDETPVTADKLILEMLSEMQSEISELRRENRQKPVNFPQTSTVISRILPRSAMDKVRLAMSSFLQEKQITIGELSNQNRDEMLSFVQVFLDSTMTNKIPNSLLEDAVDSMIELSK